MFSVQPKVAARVELHHAPGYHPAPSKGRALTVFRQLFAPAVQMAVPKGPSADPITNSTDSERLATMAVAPAPVADAPSPLRTRIVRTPAVTPHCTSMSLSPIIHDRSKSKLRSRAA